ncbi:hypothetical protein [Clostridium sp. YIM B02555]|uniref:hypothetical protein n=1 Tax=Clostridium sp. YIM B02555 TaxID=2911968 RepID=UPI001EEDF0C7|nr:hypothetical protein [Clostridium sp. YIM B02555]
MEILNDYTYDYDRSDELGFNLDSDNEIIVGIDYFKEILNNYSNVIYLYGSLNLLLNSHSNNLK